MARTKPVSHEPVEIGHRARVIRRHRGLSVDMVAGLAGMSEHELSMLESGERRFTRRGQIEDLANAIGCPVVVLTGQPYLPVDRATADVLAVVPGIREAIVGTTFDESFEGAARPVAGLAEEAQRAREHLDQDRYADAGRGLGTLITELQVRSGEDADTRESALAALVTVCHVAAVIAGMIGYHDLALSAGRRGLDAATRLGDPVVLGLARFSWAGTWINVGARPQAQEANALALAELDTVADPAAADTGAAELLGMHHLLAAKLAARAGRAGDADDHLDQARALAARTGERNTAMLHFGPTNVALWTLSVGADLREGPRDYERVHREPLDVDGLHSRERTGTYHFDLARALAQYGGDRDDEAIRHLDLADRAAPVRTRNHPIARELTEELTQRARRYLREVDGLLDRFGLPGQRSPPVNN
ncbi:MAG TPA: helix-turn-helix transcriptional regulator [Pseudonocardiaceae bacterium]